MKKIYQNGDGFISKKELEDIMGGSSIPQSTWQVILNQCDSNDDGQVIFLNPMKFHKFIKDLIC